MYSIRYTKQAIKDIERLKKTNKSIKAKNLIDILSQNLFQTPPPYEKLVGELKSCYSRRIDYKNRLVYKLYEKEKIVVIIRMWTHYE